MKSYKVEYRPRGAEFKFCRSSMIIVNAATSKEAREEAITRIGDIYKIVKIAAY